MGETLSESIPIAAVFLTATLASCQVKVAYDETRASCDTDGCPHGQVCESGICVAEPSDEGSDDAGAIDAAEPGVDASLQSYALLAEADHSVWGYLDNSDGGAADPGEEALWIRRAPNCDWGPNQSWGYLRWSLSSIADTKVVEAKVQLHVYDDPWGRGMKVSNHEAHFVADDTWTEEAISWANKPAATAALATWTCPEAGAVVEFDVTAQVQAELSGDGQLSIRVRQVEAEDGTGTSVASSQSGGKAWYASREHATDGPMLLIVTESSL